jgi:sortase A
MIIRTNHDEMQRHGRLLIAGRCLTAIGISLLVIYVGATLYEVVSSRLALQHFDQMRVMAGSGYGKAPIELDVYPPVDFRFWSEERILAYGSNVRAKKTSLPLAVLRFKRLNLRVPVFAGTNSWTLNRGAGWIRSTARPGGTGNVEIAGHRDSFFRVLREASKGDTIELDSGLASKHLRWIRSKS